MLPSTLNNKSVISDKLLEEQQKMQELMKWHWSEIFTPVANFIIKKPQVDWSSVVTEKAYAGEIVQYAGEPTLMTTTNCVGPTTSCKTCTAENGCFQISVCPKFRTLAECQAKPELRYSQRILMTL